MSIKPRATLFFLGCLSLLPLTVLNGCNSFNPESKRVQASTDTNTLSALKKLSNNKKSAFNMGDLRMQALRDTALSVGARGGLADRSKTLNELLTKRDRLLTRAFNFQAMLLDKNVLPPVLIEGRDTLEIGRSADVIRLGDRNYQILYQARFVTAPPTWRDYLWMMFEKPKAPDRSLLPKTNSEKTVWQAYITEGWRAGEQQAELIFAENLARLKRDYEGMIRYRTLLAENMVSAPYVAETDLGITGDSQNMTVNDRLLRITAFPELQLNSDLWKTEITPHEPCPTAP